MNELEERLRAATHAAAEQIPPGSIPPLRQPDRRRHLLTVRSRLGQRRAPGWLAPVSAAAAMVVLVTGSVTAVHVLSHQHAAPAPVTPAAAAAAAGVTLPPYSAGLIYSSKLGYGVPGNVVIRATATGKVLATATPPKGEQFTGVGQGDASDRIFLLAAETNSEVAYRMRHARTATGLAAATAPEQFYLLSFDPAGNATQLTAAHVPMLRDVSGFALSPDASQLAVTLTTRSTLTIADYVLATGASRSWQAKSGYQQQQRQHQRWSQIVSSPTWGPGQQLSYDLWPAGTAANGLIGLLDTGTPGGSLIDNSVIVSPSTCQGGSISPDGNLIITSTLTKPNRLPWILRECAIRHGKVTVTVPGQVQHWGHKVVSLDSVLWASPRGQVLIIGANVTTGLDSGGIGMDVAGQFTPLANSAQIPFDTLSPGASVAW